MLRRHRLGTIAAEQRDTAQADQCLSHSQQHFSKRLGEDNPITGEVLKFYLLSCKSYPSIQCKECRSILKAFSAWQAAPMICRMLMLKLHTFVDMSRISVISVI